jgi:DNA-binding NarL/FixJ family response regulator
VGTDARPDVELASEGASRLTFIVVDAHSVVEVSVSLSLSPPDLHALELAQTALLSRLDYRNTDAWRVVATTRVAQLIGADQAVFTPPRTPPGAAPLAEQAHDMEGADVTAARLDTAGPNARLRGRVETSRRLYRATLGAIEIYVDWALPKHRLGVDDISIDPFPGELLTGRVVTNHHDVEPAASESNGACSERGLTFLKLLLPAFKAGVRTHLAFRVHHEALTGMLDLMADGAAIWDRAGNCRYRNRALVDLLASDAERAPLERQLADVARRMLARRRNATVADAYEVTVETAANRYRLQARYAAALGAGEPWILVLVRPARRRPSAALLRTRYGLTPRQSEVAQRLAEGQSDVVVARALGISRRTAEHHAEAVRLSVGVHSRAALAAALQQSV